MPMPGQKTLKDSTETNVKKFHISEKFVIALLTAFTAISTIWFESRHRETVNEQQELKDSMAITVARLEERIIALKDSEKNLKDDIKDLQSSLRRYSSYSETSSKSIKKDILPQPPTDLIIQNQPVNPNANLHDILNTDKTPDKTVKPVLPRNNLDSKQLPTNK